MAAIRTEEVSKTYGMNTPRQVDAIRNVSITIDEGTITAFGGPSGSGKTTLLSLIGLLNSLQWRMLHCRNSVLMYREMMLKT